MKNKLKILVTYNSKYVFFLLTDLQIARDSPGIQLGLNPVCVEFWFEPSVFILGAGATLNMNFTEDCKRTQWK